MNFKLFFICAIPIALFLSSCDNALTNNKCGGEDKDRATGFPTITPSTYKTLSNGTGLTIGDGLYTTGYNGGPNAVFIFNTMVTFVCGDEDMLVSHVLVLNHADPTLRDSLFATELPNVIFKLTEAVPQTSALEYSASEPYTFEQKDNATSFDILDRISFPTHGSWSADSTYFFSNLDAFSLSASYKTTH